MRRPTLIAAAVVIAASVAVSAAEPERPRLKVFQLKKADPSEARQLVEQLLGLPGRMPADPNGPPVPVPVPGPAVRGAVLLPAGAAPVPAPAFDVAQVVNDDAPTPQAPATPEPVPPALPPANGAPLPPPIGVTAPPTVPAAPTGTVPTCRVTTDLRTGSLVVRGLARDLDFVTEIVQVLEAPEDRPLPEVKQFTVFRLKHVDAQDLVGILGEVEFDGCKVAAYSKGKLLFAMGEKNGLKELADAVKQLDVENK